jgi:hypothetical protein
MSGGFNTVNINVCDECEPDIDGSTNYSSENEVIPL